MKLSLSLAVHTRITKLDWLIDLTNNSWQTCPLYTPKQYLVWYTFADRNFCASKKTQNFWQKLLFADFWNYFCVKKLCANSQKPSKNVWIQSASTTVSKNWYILMIVTSCRKKTIILGVFVPSKKEKTPNLMQLMMIKEK